MNFGASSGVPSDRLDRADDGSKLIAQLPQPMGVREQDGVKSETSITRWP